MSHSTWYNVMPVMPLQQTKFLGRTFWFLNGTITHNYYNWLTYSYIYTLYISMAVCDWTWVKKKKLGNLSIIPGSPICKMKNGSDKGWVEAWEWGCDLIQLQQGQIVYLFSVSLPSSHHPPSPTYAIPSSVPFPSPIFNLLAPSPIFPFSPHTINHDL